MNSITRKAAVEISLIQLIGLALAAVLLIAIGAYFAKMLGVFMPAEERAAEVAFDSLVAKINQVINDPAPLAFATMPYFLPTATLTDRNLGNVNALVGYRRGSVNYYSCPIPVIIDPNIMVLETLGYPSTGPFASVCREPNCICLEEWAHERTNMPGVTFSREFIKCASTKEYDIYFDRTILNWLPSITPATEFL